MKVSILIPCYNAERWIAAAIESALAQSWPDKEVIVVDDGSNDGSLDVIRSFGDAIRWETGPNRGGNVARNRLLELTSGDWLQYLDADDYLLPDHVAAQAGVAERNATAAVVYSPVVMEYWPECDSEVPVEGTRGIRREVLSIPQPHDPWILLVRWRLPQTGALLWRREALCEVGGWKPNQPCCQENELLFRLLAAGNAFAFNPSPGAVYRQWSPGTVCRKNPINTFRQRLAVVEAAERLLETEKELTRPRREAIALTRLECARSMYPLAPNEAEQVADRARGNAPRALPAEPPFPLAYRLMYAATGFAVSERVAGAVRKLRS